MVCPTGPGMPGPYKPGRSFDDDVHQLVGDGDDADYLLAGDGLLDFRVGDGEFLEPFFRRAEGGVDAAAGAIH